MKIDENKKRIDPNDVYRMIKAIEDRAEEKEVNLAKVNSYRALNVSPRIDYSKELITMVAKHFLRKYNIVLELNMHDYNSYGDEYMFTVCSKEFFDENDPYGEYDYPLGEYFGLGFDYYS